MWRPVCLFFRSLLYILSTGITKIRPHLETLSFPKVPPPPGLGSSSRASQIWTHILQDDVMICTVPSWKPCSAAGWRDYSVHGHVQAQVCGGWGGCPETLQIPTDVSIPFTMLCSGEPGTCSLIPFVG